MNLIIVEDEGITALFLKKTLENLGHKVISMHDRADTLFTSIKQNNIDLVFMDIEIKGSIDGVSIARKLHFNHNIPSIFVTSYKDSNTIQEAMDAKPLGYIIKPILQNDIEAAIRVAECRIRAEVKNNADIVIGPYTLDATLSTLKEDNNIIKIPKKMFPILVILFKNYGTVVSNEYLVSVTQKEYEHFQENQLRDLIYRLRQKLPNIDIVSHSKIGYSIQLKH